MINLLLAVISSSLIAILMRIGEDKISSRAGMFIANYFTCVVLARLFVGRTNIFDVKEGLSLAISLGTISGILFLVNFVLLQVNINKNGMVMSSIFMKLGVVIPVIMAIAAFGEKPKFSQIAGIMLTICAIVLINYKKGPDTVANSESNTTNASASNKKSSQWLLIVLLLVGGTTDSMMNIYDKKGAPELSANYLLFVFFVAMICAVIMQLIQKDKITKWDLLFGAAIGIPNFFSSKFQLAALNTIPAVIVYPVYSVGSILVISLVGILFFSEKLERNKLFAMIIAISALVLLNI